jgi:exodeoxyribonuclease V gamma subunit
VLHVHHADRADHLVAALADVLRRAPVDPFTPEVIAVHSRGIERWIAQRLSHHLGTSPDRADGVAANLTFPFPGAIVGEVVARAAGHDPDADPWQPDRLVWPLLDVVDEAVRSGDHALLGPLRTHVADNRGRPSDRRLGAVRRVAELFDRYAVHRPAMLQAWAGDDGNVGDRDDSSSRRGGTTDLGSDGRPLPDRDRWQPRLWRAVHARIGTTSGPERLADATAAIARGRSVDGGPLALDLPDRLAIFGVTALSATSIEVLAALAEGPTATAPDGRDVHLFLLHPSPVLWRRTATHLAEAAAARGPAPVVGAGAEGTAVVPATGRTVLPARDHDPTAGLARDPLLAAWGRDTRELQIVASTVSAEHHDHSAEHHDHGADATPTAVDPPTLLGRLQAAVHDDRPRHDQDVLPGLDRADRSVQLHRCHGPARQVEVLRDVLLHLLADDPRLEPRDVVVLCPDIERFAPLIEAVFGGPVDRSGGDDGVQLRVQLADRALRRTNPLLRVVAELLELADGRVTASGVLDLCTRGPVRRRFDLDEDDLGRLEAWLDSTGIRWGLDADHRDERGIPTAVNTWRSGLDRLLAGVAVADERLRTVGGVAPEDDVEGDAVELAGRFAELLARLDGIVRTMRTPRPVGAWLDVLTEAVGQLCEVDPDESWQEVQLGRAFGEVRDAVRGTAADTARLPLSLPEVRGLLGDRLEGAPSRAAHRTGDLTVCTLVPMRSVPHEVVVLLGMDDEVFPRRTVPDGDDLLATAPLVGDRDPRTEDRQLLLDALLAAGSHLVVLTTGHDERTGEPRPPAVPIGELLDVVDRTVTTDLRDDHDAPLSAAAAITVDHPLQPFDPRRFAPAGLGPAARPATGAGVPFGFDSHDLAAAQALVGTRTPARAFLTERLAPLETIGPLPLRELITFLHHPVQALLSQRLDVTYPRDGDVRDDRVPVELVQLAAWSVGDRLLTEVMAGRDPDRWLEVERSRGTLPPGDLSDAGVAEARRTVAEVRASAVDAGVPLGDTPEAVAIDLALPGGHRLVGAVPVIGTTRRAAAYSRLGRKARLSAWVELLALTAAEPEVAWRAVTLGRARTSQTKNADGEAAAASVSTLAPGGPREFTGKKGATRTVDNPLGPPDGPADERRDAAIGLLTQLVELRERGLCGPALLPCETAGSYAETAWGNHIGAHGKGPVTAARGAWSNTSGFGSPGEDQQPAHRLVLGPLTFEDLLAIPPEPEESGPGWDDDPSRLGRLGRRVWWPLLAAEEIEDR